MTRFIPFIGTSRTLTEENEKVELGSNPITNIFRPSSVNREEILNLEDIIDLDEEYNNYRKK